MWRWLIWLALLVGLCTAGLFVLAGRTPPPTLRIDKPDHIVGQQGTLEISATGTGGRLAALSVALEQNGRTVPLFSIDAAAAKTLWQPDADRLSIVRPFGK